MRTPTLALLLVPCLLLAELALAAPVLDQSHFGITAAVDCRQGEDCGQTFTVGIDGHLVRVEVMLSRQPSAVVDVVDLDLRTVEIDGRPTTGPPLALTSSVSTNDLASTPAWISFEFAGDGVPLTVGTRLALVVRAPFLEFPDGVSWAGSIGNAGYAAGEGFRREGDGVFEPWLPDGFDGNFRTYVEAPEPAAGMGAAAVLALGAVAARRDRRRA